MTVERYPKLDQTELRGRWLQGPSSQLQRIATGSSPEWARAALGVGRKVSNLVSVQALQHRLVSHRRPPPGRRGVFPLPSGTSFCGPRIQRSHRLASLSPARFGRRPRGSLTASLTFPADSPVETSSPWRTCSKEHWDFTCCFASPCTTPQGGGRRTSDRTAA